MDTLQSKWAIPNHVEFVKGNGGLTKVVLKLEKGPTAELYLHGAHATSFKSHTGREVLFMSSKSAFDEAKAIRGGIPVIFPQFGPGPLPQHGFARNSNSWTVEATKFNPDEKSVSVLLQLRETPDSLKVWPHQFQLQLQTKIALQDNVSVFSQTFAVANTGSETFTFTSALHTYFDVPNIKETEVGPLDVAYLDKLKKETVSNNLPKAVTFDGPMDRVYHNAADKILISSKGVDLVEVHKQGFGDMVVWNCWETACKSMADMGEHDWLNYVCCEPGSIGTPVEVAPGKEWRAEHSFHAKL